MKKLIVLILLGGFMLPSISPAIDLKQSKFTQVVNNVQVISASNKTRHNAAVNDVFKMPDVLRTGPNSRAELVAADKTVTRVGANTIFSFDPANRTIDLQQGSILFHSPAGKGGGTIRTGSATASVIGTTIIVTATPNGGFKILDLEGQAEIRFLNGLHQTLEPGQLTFILPGGSASPIVVFRLDSETKGSLLVNGFSDPLPSSGKIDAEIIRQLLQLLNNEAQDTGLLTGNNATPDSVQVVQDINNQRPPPSAFQGDGSIVGNDRVSTLPINLPLDPNHVQTAPFAPPSGIDSFSPDSLAFVGIDGNPASGFVGNNIDIDTAKIDLSSFAGNSDFDFMASGDMRIWQSVNFTPPIDEPGSLDSGQPDIITLIAGGQMLIAPGSKLEADTEIFGLVADSFGTLDTDTGTVDEQNTLDCVKIINHVGDVDVLSLQDLSVYNSTFCAGGAVDIESQDGFLDFEGGKITANGGNLSLTADGTDGSICIDDTCLKAYSTDELCCGPSDGYVTIDAAGTVGIYDGAYIYGEAGVSITGGDGGDDGDVTIYGSRIRSNGYVDIESDDGGTLTVGTDPESDVTICAGGDVTLAANGGGDVDVTDTSINAGGNVCIASDETSGNIDLKCSDVTADFSVNVSADYGCVKVNDTDLTAGGGDVTENSLESSAPNDGDISIGGEDISIDTSGYASVSSGGTINISGTDVRISDSTLDVKGDTIICGAPDISTEEGDVSISGGGGTISISGNDVSINCGTQILGNNIDVTGSAISSCDGSVNITDSGSITISSDSTAGASIYDTTINVNNIKICGSTITADNGDITIDNEGTASIPSAGCSDTFTVDSISISDSYLSASGEGTSVGDVDISTGGNVEISDETTIDAAGTVDISAGGNVNMCDSEVYFGSCDNTCVSGSEFEGGEGDVDISAGGEGMTICAGGMVTLTGTEFNPEGNINVCDADVSTSGGDINLETGGDVYVYAGCLSVCGVVIEGGGISISGSEVTACGGDVNIGGDGRIVFNGDTLCYSSDYGDYSAVAGDVTICGSDVAAYGGCVNISSGGDVDVYDSCVTATECEDTGGYVNICASGDIGIYDTWINADEGVSLDAGGSVSVCNDSGVCMDDWTIDAGTCVSVDAANCVDISDSGITAEDGDVKISAGDDLSIENDGDTISGDSVKLTAYHDVSVSCAVITANDGCVTIEASDNCDNPGSVGINAISDISSSVFTEGFYDPSTLPDSSLTQAGDGSIDEYSDYITLTADFSVTVSDIGFIADSGDIQIIANDGDADIENGSILQAKTGGVEITANSGDADIDSSYVEAYDGVTITADDDVILCDNSDGNGIYADNGDVDITSNDGAVGIYDTYISASGEADIQSSDTLTLACGTEIDAGSVYLDSFSGDADIYCSTLTANGGSVQIYADSGTVDIENSYINAGSDNNLNICSSDIIANEGVTISAVGGNVEIGGENVTVCDTTFDLGGNISISGSCVTANDGCVQITTSGTISISSDETLCVYGNEVSGASIDICDSTITANSGNVDIDDNGSISDVGGFDFTDSADGINISGSTISATGTVDISAGGNVNMCDSEVYFGSCDNTCVSGSEFEGGEGDVDISAGGEGMTICAGGMVTLTGTEFNPEGNINVCDADVSTSGGDINLETGGDVYVYAGCLSVCGVVIEGGGISISGSEVTACGGDVNIGGDGRIVFNGDTLCYSSDYGDYSAVAGDVTICGSDVAAYGGCVNISSGGDVDVYDSCVTATECEDTGGYVNICASGDIGIYDTWINADEGVSLDAGGSVSVCNDSGVCMDDWTIDAGTCVSVDAANCVDISDSGITAEDGDVTVKSCEDDVDICDSSISAGGDVEICSGGNVEISDETTIDAAGTVDISAGGNVNMCDSEVYFGSCDNTCVSGSEFEGGEGDVDISAGGEGMTICAGGMVTLTGTEFNPEGNINVCDADVSTSGGDINLETGGDVYVYAGCLSVCGVVIEGGGISISGSEVTACGGDVNIGGDGRIVFNGDTLCYSSDYGDYSAVAGDVTICGSDVAAYGGCVNISSGGDVDVYDSCVTATECEDTGGYVNICASGDIGIYDTWINADEGVSLDAGGSVSVCNDSGVCMDDWTIDAGTCVSVESHASGAGVDDTIEDNADGTVTASNGYSVIGVDGGDGELGTLIESGTDIEASGNISLISDTADVDLNSGTDVYACGGGISISALEGNVDVESSYLYAGSCHNVDVSDTGISAGDDVNMGVCGGDVQISADDTGTVTINSTTIDLGGNVSVCDAGMTSGACDGSGDVEILASGSLSISGDYVYVACSQISGSDITLNGSCITANNGDVKIDDCDNVSISWGGGECLFGDTISMGDITICGSSITANGGSICITSDGSVSLPGDAIDSEINVNDICIGDSTLTACDNINISASGNVNICDSQLYFGNGSDISEDNQNISALEGEDTDLSSGGGEGEINICAGGTVDLNDSEFYVEGSLDISESSITSHDADVNITTGGDINVYGGWLSVSGVEIEGGSIAISDSSVTAFGGNVNIGGDGEIIFDNSLYIGGGYTAVAGDVCISDSNIAAIGGDVNINSGGTVTVLGDSGEWQILGNSVNLTADGDVDLYDAYIAAVSGCLNINAGGVLTIDDNDVSSGQTVLSGDMVTLSGDEGVTLGSYANGDASIMASDGTVLVESADGDVLGYGVSITADGGDVDVYGCNGSVSLDYATVYADDDVTITGGSAVTIYDDNITANDGDVDITAEGTASTIDLQGDVGAYVVSGNSVTLTAGGDINLYDAVVTANSGCLNINAGGVLTVDDGDFSTGSTILSGNMVLLSGTEGVLVDTTVAGGDASITANTGDADIYGDYGNVELDSSSVTATDGNVNIYAGYSDSLGSETLTLNNDTITAGGSVTLSATGNLNTTPDEGGITISGTSISANQTSGMICVNNGVNGNASGPTGGIATIDNGSSMQAFYINVNSPDGILINSDGTPGKFAGNTMNLTASLGTSDDDATGAHTVTVENTDLGELSTVNIQAHTVNMNNDNFSSSSSYNLTSFYGGYHINDGNVAGYVNFNNDTLDNSTAIVNTGTAGAANQSNNGGITLGGSGAGIHIFGGP